MKPRILVSVRSFCTTSILRSTTDLRRPDRFLRLFDQRRLVDGQWQPALLTSQRTQRGSGPSRTSLTRSSLGGLPFNPPGDHSNVAKSLVRSREVGMFSVPLASTDSSMLSCLCIGGGGSSKNRSRRMVSALTMNSSPMMSHGLFPTSPFSWYLE